MKRHPIPPFSKLAAANPSSSEFFDALEKADRREIAIRDIGNHVTSLEASLEEARAQALTNPVSGLPNRLAFDNTLAERIKDNDKIAVAILDLTNFKKVNDSEGHSAGDTLLQSTGQILMDSTMIQKGTRHGDFVAHLGGDEYAIIFDMTPRKDRSFSQKDRILGIRNHICKTVEDYSKTYLPDGLDIAVAIGIAERQPGQTAEELFDAADGAMYLHKEEQHEALGTIPR